jgi:hypothetical protein
MKKISLYILLLIVAENFSFSQDTAIVKYYPLAPGNKWVYQRDQWVMPGPGKDVAKVESTFVYNNHRYYVLKNTMYLSNGTVYLYSYSTQRVDSLTGNIYKFDSTGECLIDSLRSSVGDSALSCVAWSPADWFCCMDTSNYPIFGQNPKSKEFSVGGFEWGMNRRYSKNFGIVYMSKGAHMAFIYDYLKGCIINGILYGDTTLLGINPVSGEIPVQFSLSQNYPNPFNPSTKIKFDIPPLSSIGEGLGVRLVIYDILGREVAVLVNEQLKSGTYEVEWDGSNYPSGVYFYKLTIVDASAPLSITKKMMLIK